MGWEESSSNTDTHKHLENLVEETYSHLLSSSESSEKQSWNRGNAETCVLLQAAGKQV